MPVGYNGQVRDVNGVIYDTYMDDAFTHDSPEDAPCCDGCGDSLFDCVYYVDAESGTEILCGNCME